MPLPIHKHTCKNTFLTFVSLFFLLYSHLLSLKETHIHTHTQKVTWLTSKGKQAVTQRWPPEPQQKKAMPVYILRLLHLFSLFFLSLFLFSLSLSLSLSLWGVTLREGEQEEVCWGVGKNRSKGGQWREERRRVEGAANREKEGCLTKVERM